MPVDYVQVLADLDAEVVLHRKAIEELEAARPAIVALRNKFVSAGNLPFTGMGATAAIRALLSHSSAWYSTSEILGHLFDKGWKTDSSDPIKVVASTLSQIKAGGFIERQHDMWRWLPNRIVPMNVQATSPTVFDLPSEQ
jgi:hypothetical protein